MTWAGYLYFFARHSKSPRRTSQSWKGWIWKSIDITVGDAPTGKNLKQNLKKLEGKPAESFMFFYYTGHDDWKRVIDQKDFKDKYEVLCIWDGEISDTDLEDQLDVFAPKHTILAMLHCCFSGGADRVFCENSEIKFRWLERKGGKTRSITKWWGTYCCRTCFYPSRSEI